MAQEEVAMTWKGEVATLKQRVSNFRIILALEEAKLIEARKRLAKSGELRDAKG